MSIQVKKLIARAKVPKRNNGDLYDLYTARIDYLDRAFAINGKIDFDKAVRNYVGVVDVVPRSVVIVRTGLAMKLPDGKFAKCYPRSSTFKKYGLLLTNSVGIIDNNYCGPSDEWTFVFYCTRYAEIPVDERFVQFELVDSTESEDFNVVDELYSPNRGGYGSTDKEK